MKDIVFASRQYLMLTTYLSWDEIFGELLAFPMMLKRSKDWRNGESWSCPQLTPLEMTFCNYVVITL